MPLSGPGSWLPPLMLCLLVAAAPAAAQPLPVIVAPVESLADDARLELTGSGLARRSATLQPAVAGEVTAVAFRAGQRVRAGQPLVRLDDTEQRLAVAQAETRLDAARRLFARYQRTEGSGAVPGSVIDDARTALREAELALEQARTALAERELRAPFDGVLGLAQVQPGDRVGPDRVVTTLDDRSVLRVHFAVPEAYLARLAVGQRLEVSTPAFDARRFAGRIVQIDSRVDAAARTLRLEAEVPNTQDLLRPGMSFTVRLALPGQPRLAVPELALQWGREGAFVWVVREGRAARVPVRTLRRQEGRVLVDGALKPGDAVVVEGVQRLRDGAEVRRVNGNGAAAASAAAARP